MIDPRKMVLIGSGGLDAILMADFFAFDPASRAGVSVATSDMSGTGKAVLFTGTGAGQPPMIRGWDVPSMRMVSEFVAFDLGTTDGFSLGGGDGYLLAGAGPDGGSMVKVYHGADEQLVTQFKAYAETFKGGVQVNVIPATASNGTKFITGAAAGGGPHVRVLSPALDDSSDFYAFDRGFGDGVTVS